MARKRNTTPSKAKMRNLMQYKDLTDDEFETVFQEKYETKSTANVTLNTNDPYDKEKRIQEKIDALGKDYDLTDMKMNDMAQLVNYASASLQLDDVEDQINEIQSEGITQFNVTTFEKLNNIASRLRSDISSIFQDLGINRKHRKSQNEQSVIDAITDIKKRAKKYVEGKMVYVFCPKCRQLLLTSWVHYKQPKLNMLNCTCGACGNSFVEDLSLLYDTNHKNIKDVLIP